MSNTGCTLLVLGKVWPEPASSAAGLRILQIIELFQTAGYAVTFASAAGKTSFSADLEKQGIHTVSVQINDSGFDEFVRSLNPDVVLFDRFTTEEQYGWRVTEQCPNAVKVLDTEDLHFLRQARHLLLKKGGSLQDHLHTEATIREMASMYRCDLTLIISQYEMHLLTEHFQLPDRHLFYLPFLVHRKALNKIQHTPGYQEREHFMSIGNFLHPPNVDSVWYLKNEIWPAIRRNLPTAELHIFGAYPSSNIYQHHNPAEGFIVKGRAENVHKELVRYRVLLAPLRFGAGLKGKLLDAMLSGTPAVTTTIGAEGMYVSSYPGMIADTPQTLAQAAVGLYTDCSLWNQARDAILPTLQAAFLAERFGPDFLDSIHSIKTHLTQHRAKNFIGKMLHHQSMQATKYMSKWIEAKNRR